MNENISNPKPDSGNYRGCWKDVSKQCSPFCGAYVSLPGIGQSHCAVANNGISD